MMKTKCAVQIKEALERQMSKVKYFIDGVQDESKLNKAPISNLGPESNFGSVGEDLTKSGNSTNLSTVSEKHIIEKNKLHTRGEWKKLSQEEKVKEWKWAKNSTEVKQVRLKEKELKDYLDSVSLLAVDAKKSKKLRQNEKLMKTLENCKMHGGPVTAIDIDLLDSLNEDQVKSEVAYLKLTYGASIRYKRKVGKKFVNFTVDELRSQIRDVIKPVTSSTIDINEAIKSAILKDM